MAATVDKGAEIEAAELHQLRSQLQELENSATVHGLWLTATLIGAAFESISEEMDQRYNSGGRYSRRQGERGPREAPARRNLV